MEMKIGKVSKTRLGKLNKLARSVIRQRTPFDKHLRIRAQEVLELVTELQKYRYGPAQPHSPLAFALQADWWSLCALIGGLALCLKHPNMDNSAGQTLKLMLDSLIDHFSSLTPPPGVTIPEEMKKEWAVWKDCKTLPLPMEGA